jgi:septal ring factor EnvC (AmiA/AmiB activator)
MMGLSQGAPGPEEVIKIATAMAMPAAAKARLQDIGQQLDALNKRREEIATLQAQIDAARSAADKFKAELDVHAQDLANREQQLNARAARIQAVADQFGQALARHVASLEQTS